jgi:hypothetical protein
MNPFKTKNNHKNLMRQFPLKNLPYFELFNYSYHKKKPKEIKNEYILCREQCIFAFELFRFFWLNRNNQTNPNISVLIHIKITYNSSSFSSCFRCIETKLVSQYISYNGHNIREYTVPTQTTLAHKWHIKHKSRRMVVK